jgi:hypothetical protein
MAKTLKKKSAPGKTAKKTVKKTAMKPAKKPAAKKPAAKKPAAKKAAPQASVKSPAKKAAAKRPEPKKVVQTKPQGKKHPAQKPTPLTATGSNVLWKLLARRKAQAQQQDGSFTKMIDKATEKERFANHQARFSRFAGPRRRAS